MWQEAEFVLEICRENQSLCWSEGLGDVRDEHSHFLSFFLEKYKQKDYGEGTEDFLCWDRRWIWADVGSGKGSALEFGMFLLLLVLNPCG